VHGCSLPVARDVNTTRSLTHWFSGGFGEGAGLVASLYWLNAFYTHVKNFISYSSAPYSKILDPPPHWFTVGRCWSLRYRRWAAARSSSRRPQCSSSSPWNWSAWRSSTTARRRQSSVAAAKTAAVVEARKQRPRTGRSPRSSCHHSDWSGRRRQRQSSTSAAPAVCRADVERRQTSRCSWTDVSLDCWRRGRSPTQQTTTDSETVDRLIHSATGCC